MPSSFEIKLHKLQLFQVYEGFKMTNVEAVDHVIAAHATSDGDGVKSKDSLVSITRVFLHF